MHPLGELRVRQRQHNAQLAEQPPDAVDQGGAVLYIALPGPMDEQQALLLHGLDGHKTHVRSCHRFANRCGIGRIVLDPAVLAVWSDKLGSNQAHGMAQLLKLAGPVVGARAGLHANEARRQAGNEFKQLGSLDLGLDQQSLPGRIDPMNGKHVLGQIDPNRYDTHGLPLSSQLMRVDTPSWRSVAVPHSAARSGRGSPSHSEPWPAPRPQRQNWVGRDEGRTEEIRAGGRGMRRFLCTHSMRRVPLPPARIGA